MASAEVAALNEIDKTASFEVNATADLDDMEFNEMLGGQIPATDGFLMSSWFEEPNLDFMGRRLQSSPTTLSIDWATAGHV